MTLHPISIAIGALLGGLGAWFFSSSMREYSGDGVSTGTGATLNGRIVPGSPGSSPSGSLVPLAGVASRDDYEWGYIVGPGDSLEGIAQAITGNDGHYQELLLANPQLKMVGEAGVYLGDKAWGAEKLTPGEGLLLPVPWSRYIDQMGHPRGTTTPFPKDSRSDAVLGAGAGVGNVAELNPYRPAMFGGSAAA